MSSQKGCKINNRESEDSCLNENDGENIKAKRDRLEFSDFDDVLRHIGGWGRYQVRLLLWCLPFTLFLSYAAYSPILYLYLPQDHRCRPDPRILSANTDIAEEQMVKLTSPADLESPTGLSRCKQYALDFEQKGILEQPSNVTSIIPCQNGRVFNLTGYFHSASTDMDWACEDAWKSAFTQSLFYLGGVIGTLIFGYTADKLGRLWTVLASNGVLAITGLATPFCTDFISFSLMRFLMGTSHITFFATYLLLALEFVSVEMRALVGNLSLAVAITLGGCYQPWLIMWLGDWKPFHHVLFLQTLVVVFAPCSLHESMRWLASKGRMDECLDVMGNIYKINNGCSLDKEAEQAVIRMVDRRKRREIKSKPGWTKLFTTPGLRKNFLIMILTWMLIASMFDGHIRNIANLEYSIYASFTISSLLELPSDLLAIWGLNFLGRRWSASLSQLLAAISTLFCLLFRRESGVRTFLALMARFFITYAMNTGTQITYEVVPTVLRGQGTALANVFAQVAQFFSPYIVHSSSLHPDLPFVILGLGSLIGASVAMALPETAGVDLPDTLDEARIFGKEQHLWDMPCLQNNRHNNKHYVNTPKEKKGNITA